MLLLLRGRPLLAAVALAGAVLTYEAVFGLALLAIAVWVVVDLARRWKIGAVVGACVVAAGGLLYVISPKRTGATHVGGFDRMMSSQFGVGIFEWSSVARLAPVVLTVGLLLVVVLHYRQQRRYRTVVLSGFVLLLAGWLPVLHDRLADRHRRVLRSGQRRRRARRRGAARRPPVLGGRSWSRDRPAPSWPSSWSGCS